MSGSRTYINIKQKIMTIIGRITWKGEVTSYTSRNGEQKTLLKIRLTSGHDSCIATCFADAIASITALQSNQIVVADVTLCAREWQTQTGEVQRSTDVMLNRICPL